MYDNFYVCLLPVLFTLLTAAFFECLLHFARMRHRSSLIVINAGDYDNIECIIRSLMAEHPQAEVMILTDNASDENKKIIKLLCRDFACVHTDII